MSEKAYHHGDLKNALIEAGIDLINESGEGGLSLRKAAARCGVSQAAPYAHFKSKDALISAIQEHVTASLMQSLDLPEDASRSPADTVDALGEAYIRFFLQHPSYFHFLWFSSHIQIHLTAEDEPDAYPPYRLFRRYAIDCFQSMGMPQERWRCGIVRLWATVQGIAALATQSNVRYDGDWSAELHEIMMNEGESNS
jgi:AcrR family transcriptional regulator